MNRYYISFGSNMDEPKRQIEKAIAHLASKEGVRLGKTSSFYRTPPWGNVNQADFLNGVVEIYTNLEPQEVLAMIQMIEKEGGRERVVRWGPRTIDLDLIYGEFTNELGEFPRYIEVHLPNLDLPHPYFWDRAFVLVPLAELNSEFIWREQAIKDRLKELDTTGIERIEQ